MPDRAVVSGMEREGDAKSDGWSAIHRHVEGGGYRLGSRERGQGLVSDGVDEGVEVV
ncbi:MAG TPA: hypothetical protein VIY67_00655 [Nitrospiraceae bacterium]